MFESRSRQANILPDNPSSIRKLDEIQILRALAALLVVFHHVLLTAPRYYPLATDAEALGSTGQVGVDIFFVISGFIMMTTRWNDFGRRKASYKFIADRLQRIAPLYWLATGLVVGIAWLLPSLTTITVSWEGLITSFLFIPLKEFPILKVGWSLNYELYFYIIFSIFLFWKRDFFLRFGPIFVVASIALGFLLNHEQLNSLGFTLRMVTNPLLAEFALGCAIGVAYKYRWRVYYPAITIWAAVSFIAISALAAPTKELRIIFWGIPSALILLGVLGMARAANFTAQSKLSKLFCHLGDSSYSLYLFHPIAMPAIGKLWVFFGLNTQLALPFYIVFSILACAIIGHFFFIVIETPIIKYFRARRARPASSSIMTAFNGRDNS